MTLCPDGVIYTDPGTIFITSGFLHTGNNQVHPPAKAVPKWQDAFKIEEGTYMFDKFYCLVQVRGGVSKILDYIGIAKGMFLYWSKMITATLGNY